MPIKLRGIMPPHVTPFDQDEEVDEEALRRLVHYWINSGSSGLVTCGSNGEAPYLNRAERRRVLEVVIDEVNDRVPVIAGTGAPSTRETVDLTRDAKEVGADAALIVAPYFFTPNDDELLNHYRIILDSVDLPVILYNVPKFTGYNMSIGVIRRLVDEYSQVIGIKDSSGLIGRISELVAYVGDRTSVLAGTADVILPSLEVGASGAIVAIANVVPKLCCDIYDAFQRRDYDEARRLQLKAVLLNELLVKKNNQVSAIKEALNILGQPAGCPRKPSLPLGSSAREEIRSQLFKFI
ncbi:MAG: 4-hydroxy-tetrahydrodipicolinate synthase [Nitrososphaeria archaeon]